ncbi:DUF6491 family protein [Rheinheimera baltica]|uniref:DUF6491 family protein n=1 Tax=Rheinheimera baltica TaxID=67576 RepID=A0ABT9I244_9GAMM|nr:DUF6491 family protein [Rheinheimera baltica]MDP5137456.1 DUF6491 family protein [Rheinheimera baltica]
MMMKFAKLIFAQSILALLFGCANYTKQDTTTFDKNNDPRIGEEVRQLCFTQSISGWRAVDNDRSALLVNMGSNETYKVALVGACDPDWATMGIAVISRAGCMSAGDKIVTDAQPKRHAACTVSRIYKWNDNVDSPQQVEMVSENN